MALVMKVRAHPRSADQFAVEVIGPLVIGTNDPGAASSTVRTDLRSPMPTGVMKSANHTVATSHCENRGRPDRHGQIRPGLGELDFEPDHQPSAGKQLFYIELIHVLVAIERSGQRVSRLAP